MKLNVKPVYRMMSRHRSVYIVMSKIKPPVSSFRFYSSLTLGFANFFLHCKDTASLIVKQGTAFMLSDHAKKKGSC